MPTTPDAGDLRLDDLPAVTDELERITSLIADPTVLITPTAERVMTALASHAWVHFACHGVQDMTDPSRGAVYLADGPLTVLRIAAEDFANADLAFLSACETAVGGIYLLDEAIHLAAALMLAGYRQVIATLWPVNDQSTAVLVTEFYRLLAERLDPATAVHQACRQLRDATARDLAEWFERRYDDSGGTDLAGYEAAADFRSLPDPADRPYADPVYWAGFAHFGP
jgi:CHAT domain-containing protein